MVSVASHIRPLRRVEYDRLVALGTFDGERVEHIAGELRRMSPIGTPHSDAVDRLTKLFGVGAGQSSSRAHSGQLRSGRAELTIDDFLR